MGSKNPCGAKKKKDEKMNENRLSRRDVKIMYVFRNEMKERFLQKKKEKIWDETSVNFLSLSSKERERKRGEKNLLKINRIFVYLRAQLSPLNDTRSSVF